MIILKRYNEGTNLIQFIIGPETDALLDVSGALYVDFSSVLNDIPDAEKRKIVVMITRSQCEAFTNQHLQNSNGEMPVSSPEFPTHKHSNHTTTPQQQKKAQEKKVDKPMPISNDPRGLFLETLKCSQCSAIGAFVKTSVVPKCAMCIKIDQELALKKKGRANGGKRTGTSGQVSDGIHPKEPK